MVEWASLLCCAVLWRGEGSEVWWGVRYAGLVGWEIRSAAWRWLSLLLFLLLLLLLLLLISSLCLCVSYLCFRFAHVFDGRRRVAKYAAAAVCVFVCVSLSVCVCVFSPACGIVPYDNLGHLMRFTCSSPLPLPLSHSLSSCRSSRLFKYYSLFATLCKAASGAAAAYKIK